MKCWHCCSNSSSHAISKEWIFLSDELLEQRIDGMISFGIKEFYITGGEPFLVKNIFQILEHLNNGGAKVNIATNGYYVTVPIIKRIADIGVNLLHVSLDGHVARIHNALRGGEFFDKVVDNIKAIVKYQIPMRIGCTIGRGNENFLEEMVNFCISLGVKELRFNWLMMVGRLKENPQIYPKKSYTEMIQYIEILRGKYKDQIQLTIHRDSKIIKQDDKSICPGGDSFFFLDSEGQISPCSWIAKSDRSFTTKKTLRNLAFQKLLQESEITTYREMVKMRREKGFIGCPFIAYCRNGSYYSYDKIK